MLTERIKILIVDDDDSIRFTLAQIFRSMGHTVRKAEDGFHALQELNDSPPDILFSDLNMPRMSGFELLSIVRRRFPVVYGIGMTGGFIDRLPVGIAADAFYRKASGISTLFQVLKVGVESDRAAVLAARKPAPIWVPPAGAALAAGSTSKEVLLSCPQCLRAFPQLSLGAAEPKQTACAFCQAPIHFAVVEQYA